MTSQINYIDELSDHDYRLHRKIEKYYLEKYAESIMAMYVEDYDNDYYHRFCGQKLMDVVHESVFVLLNDNTCIKGINYGLSDPEDGFEGFHYAETTVKKFETKEESIEYFVECLDKLIVDFYEEKENYIYKDNTSNDYEIETVFTLNPSNITYMNVKYEKEFLDVIYHMKK